MHRLLAFLALAPALALGACGSAHRPSPPRGGLELRAEPPPPPATAGTLARIADGPATQRRLGYVNRTALSAADLPLPAGRVVRAVLGRSAGASAAVRAGDRLVAPSDRPVPTTSITPDAMSAAQACLGDTLAQTILGPQTMGRDAALAVGLTGEGVRICGAPHYLRDVTAMRSALARRYPGADVARDELGERVIVSGVVAVRTLGAPALLRLLAGGPELRGLAWR